MDGNGRWALKRGLPRFEGHNKGADSVRTVTRACRRLDIRALTLYAFSEQNWNRPVAEVESLMALLRRYLLEERAEIMDNDIRLTTIGRTHRLPSSVSEPLEELMRDSAGNQSMDLCLALSYGGQEEVGDAVRRLARQVADGVLDPDAVNEQRIGEQLWSSHLPPLDLLIRTSGELRLSNFMLWQAAYSELFFTPTLWPDYCEEDLKEALDSFRHRERRFGRTDEKVEALLQAND